MIKLDSQFVTTVTSSLGGVTSSVATDTLFVKDVRLDFTTGAIYATMQRGTGDPFSPNMDDLNIVVNPDGSFISADRTWNGSVASAPALVAQLKAAFDGFVLASGKVTGTAA